MKCPQCGAAVQGAGEPVIEELTVSPEGAIEAFAFVPLNCTGCGSAKVRLEVDLRVDIPSEYRGPDHDLEIGTEATVTSIERAGFPVTASCSCGKLKTHGSLEVRYPV